MNKLAVIALGGNSLIKDKTKQSVHDQYLAAYESCEHIVDIIESGYNVVITHGNGPQVGFILLRSELARNKILISGGMHSKENLNAKWIFISIFQRF